MEVGRPFAEIGGVFGRFGRVRGYVGQVKHTNLAISGFFENGNGRNSQTADRIDVIDPSLDSAK